MAETPARSNGFRWPKTGLPLWVLAVAVVLAVGIVSGLIALLYEETQGPGEILREFADAVDDSQCDHSYELLDESVRSRIAEDTWCDRLSEVDRLIDGSFALEQAVLKRDTAVLTITGSVEPTWRLRRFGERSWRVLGPPEGF
jgi:hypothetical protein